MIFSEAMCLRVQAVKKISNLRQKRDQLKQYDAKK